MDDLAPFVLERVCVDWFAQTLDFNPRKWEPEAGCVPLRGDGQGRIVMMDMMPRLSCFYYYSCYDLLVETRVAFP